VKFQTTIDIKLTLLLLLLPALKYQTNRCIFLRDFFLLFHNKCESTLIFFLVYYNFFLSFLFTSAFQNEHPNTKCVSLMAFSCCLPSSNIRAALSFQHKNALHPLFSSLYKMSLNIKKLLIFVKILTILNHFVFIGFFVGKKFDVEKMHFFCSQHRCFLFYLL